MEFRDFECKSVRYVPAREDKAMKIDVAGKEIPFDPIKGHPAFFELEFEVNIIRHLEVGGYVRTSVSIETAVDADIPPLTGPDAPFRAIERVALRELEPVIRALADEISVRSSRDG